MRHATDSVRSNLRTGCRWHCAGIVIGGWLATAIGQAYPGTENVLPGGSQVESESQPERATETARPPSANADAGQPGFVVRSLRGRVVWMSEALARRHQVQTVPEAAERILALETDTGQLFPLVEDVRGRAFRGDQRLREMNVELLVRQHQGSPMVQVIQVFEMTAEGRWELDYWCDICAIAMFELKPCDCCQAPNELRRRRMPAAK